MDREEEEEGSSKASFIPMPNFSKIPESISFKFIPFVKIVNEKSRCIDVKAFMARDKRTEAQEEVEEERPLKLSKFDLRTFCFSPFLARSSNQS